MDRIGIGERKGRYEMGILMGEGAVSM